MAQQRKAELTLAASLLEMLKKQGIDVAGLVATAPKPAPAPTRPRRTRKAQYSNAVAEAAAPVAKTTAQREPRQYGRAPVDKGSPTNTHVLRLNALEAAVPGIGKEGYIFSVGKNVAGQPEKRLSLIANNPWTWVELPGKDASIGALSAEEVRTALCAAGYGWSPTNRMWATDSNGNPCRRSRGYASRRVGRSMIDED